MTRQAPGSIEARLRWLLGLLLLLLLAGLFSIGLSLAWSSSLQFVATRLAHDGEAILSAIDPSNAQLQRSLPGIYQQPLSGHYLSIRFGDGQQIRSRSLWDEDLPLPELAPGEQQLQRLQGPRQQQLLLWSAAYLKDGVVFQLGVAEDISSLHAQFRRLLLASLLAALIGAGLLLLAQAWLLRRLFRRLDQARQQLGEVSAGQRQQLDAPVPSEIRPLVEEFNQLLHALQAHLTRTRHAAGNLAHALKGPLQLMQYRARQLEDAELEQQSEQMRHLIERELHRARLAGSALAGRRFVPRQDLTDLADSIRALYADKPLQLDWRADCAESLPLDQDDMMELLGNLLDNAAKYCQQRIQLQLQQTAEGLLLTLEDDGLGLEDAQINRLKQRGKRLDEHSPGHGLGLAIVSDIVESYSGSFDLDRSEKLGGLRSRILLLMRVGAEGG
jgi:signal transduction histidine kinase